MLTADVLTGFIYSPEVACHSQIIFVSYSVARDGTECTRSDVFLGDISAVEIMGC